MSKNGSRYKSRITGYGEEAPDQLLANPKNWRIHPTPQQQALAGVLEEVGWVDDVIVNRTTGHLRDGHLRVSLALRNNEPTIPVKYVELTEQEEALILATFDPIASLAATDAAQLDALLRDVQTGSEAVQAMLGEMAAAAGLYLNGKGGAGGDDFDATPEEGPTRTQTGDLWQLGEHRLIVGDSTDKATVDRLMQGERAGAVVTDSPYGIDRAGIANDSEEGLRALFDSVLERLPIKDAVVVNFQSPRLLTFWLDAVRAAGHKFERVLWMYKPNDETFPWRGWLLKSEAILISSKGKGAWQDVHPYSHDCYSPTTLGQELPEGAGWHASVKPLAVVADIVERVSRRGQTVYDPFLGSGTTLIAAHRLGRKCYGCEIEPKYADVILRRYEAETGAAAVLLERAG